MVTLGDRIREWREAANWSQRELGEKVGLTQAAIHNYETNQRQPSLRILGQIAQAFGRSRDDLLSGISLPDDNINQPPVDLLRAAGYEEALIVRLMEGWDRYPTTFRLDVVARARRRVAEQRELDNAIL